MREQIFEAETVDAALEQASQQWKVDLDALKYEVLETEADDFWGLEGTSVRVRVRLPDDGAAPEGGEQAPAPEGEPEQAAAPEAEAETPAVQPRPEAPQPRPEERAEEPREQAAPGPEREEPSERPEPSAPSAQAAETPEERQPSAPSPQAAETPEEGQPGAPAGEGPEEGQPSAAAAEVPEERQTTAPAAEAEVKPEDAGPRAAPAGAEGDIEALIEGLLERVFDAIDFDCTVAVTEGEDTIHVHIGGEDKEYLVDRKGRALSSLQLILNHAFRHREVGEDKKIRVDAGDFRERREEELQDLAFQVAHRAKETGEDQETQQLNPYERRIVHLALADDPGVTTRSQGNGFLKSVLVAVQRKGGGKQG